MKSLYEPAAVDELKSRLTSLTPATQRQWGKIDAAQMLAHLCVSMETVVGDRVIPRVLIGRIIGPLFKSIAFNDKPLSKSTPTAPAFVITDPCDLDAERTRLIALITRFVEAGPPGCTTAPHCFFGPLTAEQWGKSCYKHIDHHLKQFNA